MKKKNEQYAIRPRTHIIAQLYQITRLQIIADYSGVYNTS